MTSVTHIAIHHDPQGRCNEQLARHVITLREIFEDSYVVITRETEANSSTKRLLERAGFKIIPRNPIRSRQIDTGASIALVAGYARGEGELLFFGCLDRTLHWLDTYPEELREVVEAGTNGSDYLVVGRTERAFATHPPVQRGPEYKTNEVASELLSMPGIDVDAGCRIMTRDSAQAIIKFLRREHKFSNWAANGTIDIANSTWPVVAQIKGKKVGFVKVEGLEFETPDQYKREIEEKRMEALGRGFRDWYEYGYEMWLDSHYGPEEIATRWKRAYATEDSLVPVAAKFSKERQI